MVCLIASLAQAQLKVKPINGRVVIGDIELEEQQSMAEPPNARDTLTAIKIYGPKFNGGRGRITFGDQPRRYYFNVAVGECERPNDYDTDQLWLHGKNGFYFTAHVVDTLFYFDPNKSPRFNFNYDINAIGLFVNSDSRYKENVAPLSNALSNIACLKAVSYNLKNNYTSSLDAFEGDKPGEKFLKDEPMFEKMHKEARQGTRYGFIAQELKEVFPDLVHSDKDGYLSVDYIGLIPVLVEAINELQSELSEFKAKKSPQNTELFSSADDMGTGLVVPALYQNVPNPFTNDTQIKFDLPETVQQATLFVYDMQGKQVKSIPVNERGSSSVTIQGSELAAGMYIYALIADGKEIDSKRMILTK